MPFYSETAIATYREKAKYSLYILTKRERIQYF